MTRFEWRAEQLGANQPGSLVEQRRDSSHDVGAACGVPVEQAGIERTLTHTSVVIAWAPEDRPTDAQIGAVLDEFEKTAWASPADASLAHPAASFRLAGPRIPSRSRAWTVCPEPAVRPTISVIQSRP